MSCGWLANSTAPEWVLFSVLGVAEVYTADGRQGWTAAVYRDDDGGWHYGYGHPTHRDAIAWAEARLMS